MEDYVITSKSYMDDERNLFMDVTLNDHGKIIEKRLSIDDYLRLFEDSIIEKKEEWVEVEKLPEHVIWYKKSVKDAKTFQAVLVYPAQVRPFFYMDQQMMIPFPALCMKVKVREGVRTDTSLFALESDVFDRGAPLFHYPFGNVGVEGKCCFGNISISNLKDIKDAYVIFDAFMMGKTNNDLYFEEKNTKKLSQGELVETIRNLKAYPVELLNRNTSLKWTLGSLMK